MFKGGVVQANVDAGLDSFVKLANTISHEDKNATIVFENSEEDFQVLVTMGYIATHYL